MSTTIHDCHFAPEDRPEQQINPLDPLRQTGGDLDIRDLVHRIVTEDFDYKGSKLHTLTLHNTDTAKYMTLEIWDGTVGASQRETRTIDLNTGNLTLANGTIKAITHITQTERRMDHALIRISRAYSAADISGMPSPSTSRSARVFSRTMSPIPADNSGLEDAMRGMEQELRELRRQLEQQRFEQGKQIADEVRRQTQDLERRLEQLEAQIQQLREQNAALLGIQRAIGWIESKIPENLGEITLELKHISESIRQLKTPGRSDETNMIALQQIRDSLSRLAEPTEALKVEVEQLRQEKERLLRENAVLRERDQEQQAALSLKDRSIQAAEALAREQAARLEQLEASLREATDAKEAALRGLEGAGRENEGLKRELKASQESERALRQEVQGLQEQLRGFEQLKAQTASLREEVQRANATIEEQGATIARLQQEARLAGETDLVGQEALEALEAQLRGSKEDHERTARSLAEAEAYCKTLIAHQKEREEAYKALSAQQDELLNGRARDQREIESLHQQTSFAESEAKRLREANAKLDTQVGRIDLQNIQKLRLIESRDRDLARLKKEDEELRKEIERLKALLSTAERTSRSSLDKIRRLEADLLVQKEIAEREKQSAREAEETAERTREVAASLQSTLVGVQSELAGSKLAAQQAEERQRKSAQEAAQAQRTLQKLEIEHREALQELQELREDYAASQLLIDGLFKELEASKQSTGTASDLKAVKEEAAAASAKYEAQYQELLRRYKELEQERKRQDEQIAEQAHRIRALQRQIDEHKCPTLPQLSADVSTTALPVPLTTPPSTDDPVNTIVEELKRMGTEIPSAWVGNILINLDYLGVLPQDEKRLNQWIDDHFEGLTTQQITEKKRHLQLHKPQTNPAPYKEKDIRRIVGDISTAMKGAERFQKTEGRFNRPFLESVSRGKDLLELKLKLAPMVQQYHVNKPKIIPHEQQRQYATWDKTVGKAEELLRRIDEVSTLMKEKFTPEEKFKVKA